MTHPVESLDDVVHQRTRLGILSVLAEVHRAQFRYLAETLGATDGNLSRHLQVLEHAGYVTIDKGYEGRRPRTWVHITPDGRRAFDHEIRTLRQLTTPTAPTPDPPSSVAQDPKAT
ncbi:ArsR family transcriptional regulator [Acidimicrobiaceae bacterium USS-CC1]|uniref:ArsR family transcriptional regulator n=1 Tax=Acidiferrimicrobium australe TaxID=2664430 RepID=A0ABW9QRM8_9ACTN|nr:ArsR family transcriptional regulator [Acidiferrimicrobium australe]